MNKVYGNIKKLRMLKNYSMALMAKKLGITQSSYFQLEKGNTKLNIERLYEIVEILNVSVLEVLDLPLPDNSHGIVGMWALIWDDKSKLKAKVFIQSKADEKTFIVQAIDVFTCELNVAKLMTIEQMIDWTFLPNSEIAEFVLDDYYKEKINRFAFNF